MYLPTYGEQWYFSNGPFKNGEPCRQCIYAPHSLSPAAATKLRNSGVVWIFALPTTVMLTGPSMSVKSPPDGVLRQTLPFLGGSY